MQKQTLLFIILGGFFVANALIAEFIGVKIFSLEKSLGFPPFELAFLAMRTSGSILQQGYSYGRLSLL